MVGMARYALLVGAKGSAPMGSLYAFNSNDGWYFPLERSA
jgi:hypothetical protein